MRIVQTVNFEATEDVNVYISMEDIIEALKEDPGKVETLLNDVAIVLNGISDERIGGLQENVKRVVREFLKEQMERYA